MTYLEARMIGSRPKADPTVAEIIRDFRAYYADEAAAVAAKQVPAWVVRLSCIVVGALFAGALVMPA